MVQVGRLVSLNTACNWLAKHGCLHNESTLFAIRFHHAGSRMIKCCSHIKALVVSNHCCVSQSAFVRPEAVLHHAPRLKSHPGHTRIQDGLRDDNRFAPTLETV